MFEDLPTGASVQKNQVVVLKHTLAYEEVLHTTLHRGVPLYGIELLSAHAFHQEAYRTKKISRLSLFLGSYPFSDLIPAAVVLNDTFSRWQVKFRRTQYRDLRILHPAETESQFPESTASHLRQCSETVPVASQRSDEKPLSSQTTHRDPRPLSFSLYPHLDTT